MTPSPTAPPAPKAAAAEELLPLIYDELRRLAAHRMSGEAAGHTLQPTALVHEAWLRVSATGMDASLGREHFFASAAEAMRRILVESARRRCAQKRGGGAEILELDEAHCVSMDSPDLLLAVDEAVEALAQVDPEGARMVNLRYFVGMEMDEVATVLGISRRSAERNWTFARAWLRRHLDTANTALKS